MSSTVQSVMFPKDKFTIKKALSWLLKHNFTFIKVDDDVNYYRFRQQSPKKFKRYFSKKLKNGVILVIGYKK